MTKQRLSDLIRNEATQNPKLETLVSQGVQETLETVDISANSSSSRSRMTKAQLDELVSELTTTLDAEKERVNTLQTEINTLETTVKQQDELVSHLQEQLTQVEQHKTEVNEQKQLVEKLYAQLQQKDEIAAQLAEKEQIIETLQAELNQVQKTIKPAPKSQEIVAPKKVYQESALARQARELEAFTAPSSASQQKELTNQDIGWFD
ncbi:hypothetical protein VB715_15290 [Crocosphaera sp. UHCC 0190]|uniref:hypothetical protein n=1 Tax=Crocosphaera sp. UHCC 0190 TaxID=3110246 RepID=UPI002B21FFDA|nr:hypothetical protein [Crocosphaera sp. UHCC 0190]MEA5511137.1 hypothetical protein [Crocosphaera sp. UHCC 0190]